MSVTEARGELEALRVLGGESFDPPAFGFAAKLVAKGESLGGTAGARLIDRARARVAGLRSEIENARTQVGEATGDELRQRLREARKRARLGGAEPAAKAADWRTRLLEKAQARQLHLDPEASTRDAVEALYAASRREVTAMHVALQAAAKVPDWAGPYNAAAIAARTLGELAGLSPGYLAALVAHLGELAPLLTLPPIPASAPTRKPAGRSVRPRRPRS